LNFYLSCQLQSSSWTQDVPQPITATSKAFISKENLISQAYLAVSMGSLGMFIYIISKGQ
jgi:hypothetical protein